MKNLLPDFIIENVKNNTFSGELKAFILFVDISRFTSISAKIMKEGNVGAEVLSEIINGIFKPVVNHVYSNGGFIINFAGDGFISVFETGKDDSQNKTTLLRVLNSANLILNEFKNKRLHETSLGLFEMKIRLGISFGNVEWAVTGDKMKSFYFRGESIFQSSNCLKNAKENSIVFDDKFLRLYNNFKLNVFRFKKQSGGFYLISSFKGLKESAISPKNTDGSSDMIKEIFSRKFFSEQIINLHEVREFRNVISVFISFNQNLSKEILFKFLNLVINSVSHNSGYLKDIDFGDKGGVLVCFFGVPVSSGDDLNRALSMLRFISRNVSEDSILNNVKLKTGITLGKAFTGFIGSEHREQYSVLGDAVNLAARLMVKAEYGEILANEEIIRLISDKDKYEYCGKETFKGFSSEIPYFRLTEKDFSKKTIKDLSNVKNRQAIIHSGGKFIGRKKELSKLEQYTDQILSSNKSGIIYIIGEAGIGKSSLLKEFRKTYSENKNVTWLNCRTSEILKTSLSPFKYLLKNFFKQSSLHSQEENKKLFENIIEINLKQLDVASIENKSGSSKITHIKNELKRTGPVLGAMLELYWENSLYEQLEPALRFENFQLSICNLIMSECLLKPVIIEIEDIHWLDKDSADILKMMLNHISDLPLAIICTSRFKPADKFDSINPESKSYVFEMNLDFFQKPEIKDFASEILKHDIDDNSLDFILQNTNGNPYFIEQMILDLKERNLWKRKDNYLSISDSSYTGIPDSISNMLISRFDRLPGKVKESVKAASVLGREFSSRILNEILNGKNTDDLDEELSIAENQGIIYRTNESKFAFSHALLREAVYNLQMKSNLNSLHVLAAETHKKIYGRKISHSNLEQLVYHMGIGYEITNNQNKVVLRNKQKLNSDLKSVIAEYLQYQKIIAGKYKEEFRNKKVLEIYDLMIKVLQITGDDEEYCKILLLASEVLYNISEYSDAFQFIDQVLKKLNKDKNPDIYWNAKKHMAEVYKLKNDFKKSIELFNETLKYFGKVECFSEVLNIYNSLMRMYSDMGQYNKAFEITNRQLKLSRQIKDECEIARSYCNLGIIYRYKSEFDSALDYLNRSYKIFHKIDAKRFIGTVKIETGIIYFYKGLYEKSLKEFEEAREIYLLLGNRRVYAIIIGNMGNIHFTLKDFEKAVSLFKEQISVFKKINDESGLSVAYFNLANVYVDLGLKNESLELLRTHLKINKQLNRKEQISKAYSLLGCIKLADKKFSQAVSLFRKQLKIDLEISNIEGIIRAYSDIGISFMQKSDFKDALPYFRKAKSLSLKYKLNVNCTMYLLAECLYNIGRVKESKSECLKIIKANKNSSEDEFMNQAVKLLAKMS